jgi:ribonuclease H2 subunit A
MNKTKSSNNLKTLQTNFSTEHIVLGIDEAGRGPVLGPMVYACCYWAKDNENEIKREYKFADSKTLKEKVREDIYDKMCQSKNILEYVNIY